MDACTSSTASAATMPNKPLTKAYACSHCDRVFRGASTRTIHVRRHHTGEKPFDCKQNGCGKKFYSSSALGIHTKIHDTNRTKFACATCGKELLTKTGLEYHVKSIHTLERPFECPIERCNATFMTKSNLESHLKKHNKMVAKEKVSAEKHVEQLRRRNQALRERLAGENKRSHELEVKLRKLLRKVDQGPRISGQLRPIKPPPGHPLPDWMPVNATAFYIPQDRYLTIPLSNIQPILRDKYGCRFQGLDEFRDGNQVGFEPLGRDNDVDDENEEEEREAEEVEDGSENEGSNVGNDNRGVQHSNSVLFDADHHDIASQLTSIRTDDLRNTEQLNLQSHVQSPMNQSPRYSLGISPQRHGDVGGGMGMFAIRAHIDSHMNQNINHSEGRTRGNTRTRNHDNIHMTGTREEQEQEEQEQVDVVSESWPKRQKLSGSAISLKKQAVLRAEYERQPHVAEAGLSFQSWARGLNTEFRDRLFAAALGNLGRM